MALYPGPSPTAQQQDNLKKAEEDAKKKAKTAALPKPLAPGSIGPMAGASGMAQVQAYRNAGTVKKSQQQYVDENNADLGIAPVGGYQTKQQKQQGYINQAKGLEQASQVSPSIQAKSDPNSFTIAYEKARQAAGGVLDFNKFKEDFSKNNTSIQTSQPPTNPQAGNTINPTIDAAGKNPIISSLQPRQEAMVATKENPVKTMNSGKSTDEFSSLPDRDKQVQILLKQSKGEELTDTERQFMINQFLDKQEVKKEDIAPGVAEALKGQQDALQTEYDTTKSSQQTEREKLIAQKKAELDGLYGEQEKDLRDAGANQQQAMGTALSFSGFGRSTFNAEKQGEIQKNVETQAKTLNQAKDLELQMFQRQLEGEDSEALSGIMDQINGIKDQARQFEMSAAMQVAQMNQENKANFADSFSNLLQTLTPSNQKAISKDISEMLGYASDEFGNPVISDEEGNPIPLGGENEAIDTNVSEMLGFAADKFGNPVLKDENGDPIYDPVGKNTKKEWANYQDKYGNTVFYDKNDPSQTFRQPVDVYEDDTGEPTSAPTSYTGGTQDLGKGAQFKRDDGTTGYLGENCVKYARSLVPSLPMGLTTKQDKAKAIKAAEAKGLGSSDASLAQIGDAILSAEGDWGHAFVKIGENPENGNIIIGEANYKGGKVTQGREISPNDPKIFGFIRNSDPSKVQPLTIGSTKGEGRTSGMENQITGGGGNWTGSQISEFKKSMDNPDYLPKRINSPQQEQQWINDRDNWYKDGGAEAPTPLNDKELQKLRSKVSTSSESKALYAYDDLQLSLKTYYDLVDKAGAVAWNEKNQDTISNAYANLKTKWKEAANLGALTGPDLGLLEDAVPNITGVGALFKKFKLGDQKESIKGAIQAEMTRIQREAKNRRDQLLNTYPELEGTALLNDLLKKGDPTNFGGSNNDSLGLGVSGNPLGI